MPDRSPPRAGRIASCVTRSAAAAALCLLTAGAALAGDAPDSAALAVEARLEALLARVRPPTRVGLAVENVTTAQRWANPDADAALKPASVMKLLTTAAALVHLGPEFAFETRLLLHGDDLLVLGGGDPGLGDERLARRRGRPLHWEFDAWADALRSLGIDELRTIALDDTIFDQQYRHPDWPADQHQAWYQAPVGGLNFNDNCVDAAVRLAGGQVVLTLRPALPPEFFRNELRAASRHEAIVRREAGSDVFVFRGGVARSADFPPVSVNRPAAFFGHALRAALEQRGIRVRGQVVRRTLTPQMIAESKLVYVHRTPLADVLWRCNTFSQNLFAECLVKALAAYDRGGRRGAAPGSWEAGTAVMRSALNELGVPLDGAVLRDGSGLSHENRVSASQVARLLVTMRRGPHAALYTDSLADPGQEGTLARRFRDPRYRDRLVAKTGTIRGVRTLAGYVTRPDGDVLAFALLANGDPPAGLDEQVCDVLCGVSSPQP